jgi:hypothetical protein
MNWPEQWKESILVSIHKKDDKIDCSNYNGLSLVSASYKFYPIRMLPSSGV